MKNNEEIICLIPIIASCNVDLDNSWWL